MAVGWQFGDGGLTQDPNIKAPTYNDPSFSFLGQRYLTPGAQLDPALAMTALAGNQGRAATGLGAFLSSSGNNDFNAMGKEIEGGSRYDDADMLQLAKGLGIDTQGKTGRDLQNYLDPQLQDYTLIGGLSGGWNPSSDPRQGNATIYKSVDGKLVPYQTQAYHAPEVGSWLSENKGILAPLAVVGGGLLASYLGAGAAAGGGVAEGAGGTVGTAGGLGGAAPAYGGVGTAGAGAAGEGLSTLGSLQSWYAGLPAWQSGALSGAAQGGLSSGLQGKNILQGALMGGLTGGVGAAGGGWLSDATGLPSWASRAAVSSGLGGLTGGWQGALGAGLGSLAGTGLSEAGLPSGLASRLGGLAGRVGAGVLAGGSANGAQGGAGGGSGGVGMGGGLIGASSSGGGGLGGGFDSWRMPSAADAATATYLKQSYAPIALEAQKKKVAEATLEQLQEEGA